MAERAVDLSEPETSVGMVGTSLAGGPRPHATSLHARLAYIVKPNQATERIA